MQVKRIAECSKKHYAILSTVIKLPYVIKIFVLSIFKWLFYTGFTVYCMCLDATKPVFEVSNKRDSNQCYQLQRLQKIETFLVASLNMTNKRISQALIWLHMLVFAFVIRKPWRQVLSRQDPYNGRVTRLLLVGDNRATTEYEQDAHVWTTLFFSSYVFNILNILNKIKLYAYIETISFFLSAKMTVILTNHTNILMVFENASPRSNPFFTKPWVSRGGGQAVRAVYLVLFVLINKLGFPTILLNL